MPQSHRQSWNWSDAHGKCYTYSTSYFISQGKEPPICVLCWFPVESNVVRPNVDFIWQQQAEEKQSPVFGSRRFTCCCTNPHQSRTLFIRLTITAGFGASGFLAWSGRNLSQATQRHPVTSFFNGTMTFLARHEPQYRRPVNRLNHVPVGSSHFNHGR